MYKKTKFSLTASTIGYGLIFLLCLIGFIIVFLNTCYAPGYDPVKYPYIIDEVIKFEFLSTGFMAIISLIALSSGIAKLVRHKYDDLDNKGKGLSICKLMCVVSGLMTFTFHILFLKNYVDGGDFQTVIINNPVMYYVLPITFLIVYLFFDVKPRLNYITFVGAGIPVYLYSVLYGLLFYYGAWRDFYNLLTNGMWGGDGHSFNWIMLLIVILLPMAFGILVLVLRQLFSKVYKEEVVAVEEAPKLETWTCPHCFEENNVGEYCVRCGDKKPAPKKETVAEEKKEVKKDSWVCPHCGFANTSNFCSNCGTKRPPVIDHSVPKAEPVKPAPVAKPVAKPATPATKPAAPAAKPATKPAAPAAKPVAKAAPSKAPEKPVSAPKKK